MHLASNLEMSLLLYMISQDPGTTGPPLGLWNALDLVVPRVPKKITSPILDAEKIYNYLLYLALGCE